MSSLVVDVGKDWGPVGVVKVWLSTYMRLMRLELLLIKAFNTKLFTYYMLSAGFSPILHHTPVHSEIQ